METTGRFRWLLRRSCDEPEVGGLLALMLLHHARRDARVDRAGALVPLSEQDRSRWDTAMIAEGVSILTDALAHQQHGEYQIQAAIAALHDDAASASETDWVQILAWYDELLELTGNPVVALNRAVAIGEVDGPLAGLSALDAVDERLADHHRLRAARGHLHERAGHFTEAAELFVAAARSASSAAERDHLMLRAAHAGSRAAASSLVRHRHR
jgi:predicted RNA polymerase sigma factor